MTENTFKIQINQRLPLDVVADALRMFLNDAWNEQELKEALSTEYTGENRIRKAIQEIERTIPRSQLHNFLLANKTEILEALNTKDDRNIILIALINARSPFCYEVACALASQFRLQDEVTTELLSRLVGKKYGYNKSVLNALYRAVPQLAEAGLVLRPKVGVYQEAEKKTPIHEITRTIWRESFYANNPLWSREYTEDLLFEPYFKFLSV